MKKQFKLVTIALLFTIFAFGQGWDRSSSNNIGVRMPDKFYTKDTELIGSPYINKVFMVARVGNIKGTALMRYNAYNDEMEFINDSNDTLVLLKNKTYENIVFAGRETKYLLVDYTNKDGQSVNGYLINLVDKNGYSLYKKQRMNYSPERPAKNTYEKTMSANFSLDKDVFYFKHNEDAIIEFPSNRKGLIKLYPEKKEAIETFIKENKISFGKEEDLIKLVNFLAV